MIEMLIVVAVIAVAACFAVIGISASKQKSDMKLLDNRARTVYITVQNRMLHLDSTGELGQILGMDNDELVAYGILKDGAPAGTMYFSSDSTMNTTLMGTEAELVGSGFYIVEIDSVTGEVNGVFCADSAFGYDAVTALADREIQSRSGSNPPLGYCCGE